jgi:hypothetical protein
MYPISRPAASLDAGMTIIDVRGEMHVLFGGKTDVSQCGAHLAFR